jgi:phosphomannomutase
VKGRGAVVPFPYEFKMKNVVLFDMDGTLTEPRKSMPQEIFDALMLLLQYADVGIVSGSPFDYIKEQCGLLFNGLNEHSLQDLLILPCNGTQKYSYSNGKWDNDVLLDMREFIGESTFHSLMSTLIKKQYTCSLLSDTFGYPHTGHFISYRGSMINWSPVGRNANHEDREAFVKADKLYNIRQFIFDELLLNTHLTDKLAFSLGGSTSIDIYPHGWDKTYALNHYSDKDMFWFIGDRCLQDSGNDKPLYDKVNSLRPNTAFQTKGPDQTILFIKDIIKTIEENNE